MCYEVKCKKCGKTSWGGCGRHVPGVYNSIPEGAHCLCKAWPGIPNLKITPPEEGQSSSESGGCRIL